MFVSKKRYQPLLQAELTTPIRQPGEIIFLFTVIQSDVFLQGIEIEVDRSQSPREITIANMDSIQHYPPIQEALTRPIAATDGGEKPDSHGFVLTDCHELMIPLLASILRHNGRHP